MIKINRYKTLSKAMTRLSHNGRKTSFDKKKMLNMNEQLQDIKAEKIDSTDKLISKTVITNKIAKFNYRLKQYTKQLETLPEYKQKKKQKQIQKLKDDIVLLKAKREITKSQMYYAKKAYVEYTLTITKAPQAYKKDIDFALELKRVAILFLSEKFNAEICNIDIHLDQSTPHLHVMSRYLENHSLQKDLDRQYTKKRFQYSDMQMDFNQFVKDNFDFTAFSKLVIQDITRGGKKDYLPLAKYKQTNSEINNKIQKEINTILHNTQIITTLFGENQIEESDFINLLKEFRDVKKELYFLRNLSDKNKTQQQFDMLKQDNENLKQKIQELQTNNTQLQRDTHTIRKLFGKDMTNLPQKKYDERLQDKEDGIRKLKEENSKLQENFKDSFIKAQDNKKVISNLTDRSNILQEEVELKDSHIEILKSIIILSKDYFANIALEKIGEAFSSFKDKLFNRGAWEQEDV